MINTKKNINLLDDIFGDGCFITFNDNKNKI